MSARSSQDIIFENIWKKNVSPFKDKVTEFWKEEGLSDELITQRSNQLVFLVWYEGRVIAVSTAYKVHLKQFNNLFFGVRFLISKDVSMPALFASLVTKTRTLLEDYSRTDATDRAIGLVAMVENEKLKSALRSAILPTGFVYVGNSAKGHHIRIYYFRGAHIKI